MQVITLTLLREAEVTLTRFLPMSDNHHFICLDNLFTEEVYHLKILLVAYLLGHTNTS